jgi:hypothetical protein
MSQSVALSISIEDYKLRHISTRIMTVIHLNLNHIAGATILSLGQEKAPVVIIDNFSNSLNLIIHEALQADYKTAEAAYPGVRAAANPNYLKLRDKMMFQIFSEVFGLSKHISCENASYSIVTSDPHTLNANQCIPHFDDTRPNILAIMHYLKGPKNSGTGFYQHRRTGFETITPERYQAYQDGLAEDEVAYGPPPKQYICGDTNRYKMIGSIEAKPDRLIIYRGNMLHSGQITEDVNLTSDPAKGRLTVNMFLKGY